MSGYINTTIKNSIFKDAIDRTSKAFKGKGF